MIGVNRRRVMGGGSSSPYDAEVEYIECNGSQYVNTGILVEPLSDGYEYSITFINDLSGTRTIAGLWQYSFSNSNLCFHVSGNFKSKYLAFGKNWRGDTIIGPLGRVGEKSDVSIINLGDYDGNSMTMRISSPLINTDYVFDNPYPNKAVFPFVIGCVWSGTGNGAPHEYAHIKIHSFKLMRYTTPIFDGIPVRVGQVGYLYDKVSRRLLGNAGTGSFILGADKN